MQRRDDAAVAKYVLVALELGDGMLGLEVRGTLLAPGHSYSAFCTSSMVGGNISTLPMWSGWLCETATYLER